jgi:hypothetical protein
MTEVHINEPEMIKHVVEKLRDEYGRDDVEQVVEEKKKQYDGAPVRDFVPVFVERDAREELGDPGPAKMGL